MAMRPGTDTGSLVNHLLSRATKNQPAPAVGMGATVLNWTDRQAATIVVVRKRRPLPSGEDRWIVGVQEDRETIVSGSAYDGSAVYSYEPDPTAPVLHWRFDGAKGWRRVDQSSPDADRWALTGDTTGLRIGERDHYRDPSF